MHSIGVLLYWVCEFYVLVLLARALSSLLQIMAPDWQPSGIFLVALNFIYKITDPPLRFLARYIPPLRIGNIALDLGFLVLFIVVQGLGTVALSIFS